MNSILQDMLANFSPQLFIALIGGLIGGLIGAEDRQQRYGRRLAFLLIIASVIFAGAVADYMMVSYNVKSMLILMANGVFVGIVSGHLMDAVRLASPKWSKRLVSVVGNKTIEKAKDII